MENDTDPVVWRGPIIAGTVKQFWIDVIWGDVDFMFIDYNMMLSSPRLKVLAR